MFRKARYGLAAGFLLAGAIFAIGCGGDDENKASDTKNEAVTQVAQTGQGAATAVSGGSSGAREINIEEKDFSFEVSDTVRPGLVKINAKNTGKESHQVQIVKLNDGVTQPQFDAALKNPDLSALLKVVTFMGGANSIPPGQS